MPNVCSVYMGDDVCAPLARFLGVTTSARAAPGRCGPPAPGRSPAPHERVIPVRGPTRRRCCRARRCAAGAVVGVDGIPGAGASSVALTLAAAVTDGGGVGGRGRSRRQPRRPRRGRGRGRARPLRRGPASTGCDVPADRWATVVAALLDGMSLVMAELPRSAPGGRCPPVGGPGARARGDPGAVRGCGGLAGRRLVAGPRARAATWPGLDVGSGVLGERDGPGAGRAAGAQPRARAPAPRVLGERTSGRGAPRTRSGTHHDAANASLCVWCPDWPVVTAPRARAPSCVGVPVAVVDRGRRSGGGARRVGRSARRGVSGAGAASTRSRGALRRAGGGRRRPAADARVFEAVARAIGADHAARRARASRGCCRSRPAVRRATSVATTHSAALVLDAVRAVGVLDARVGIADGRFAARLAARVGRPRTAHGSSSRTPPLRSSRRGRCAATRRADDAELADLLVRLGLRTLGAFAALPAPGGAARFGTARRARAPAGRGVRGAPSPHRRHRHPIWSRPPSSIRRPPASTKRRSRPRPWPTGCWRGSPGSG